MNGRFEKRQILSIKSPKAVGFQVQKRHDEHPGYASKQDWRRQFPDVMMRTKGTGGLTSAVYTYHSKLE